MVNRSRHVGPTLILLILCLTLFLIPLPSATAQVTYTVNQEWARIWINKDGSIDLQYNITMTYLSGSFQGIVTVGIPMGGFSIQYAQDSSGNSLRCEDVSSGSDYAVDVYLKEPILNHPNTFLVYVVVSGMVYKDNTNPGNVGMLFYPSTFSDASGSIGNVRVAIVLPQGVSSGEVMYSASVPFDNVFMDGNNLVVYWERSSWPPSQELRVGVSFPEKYVALGPGVWFYIAIGAAIIGVLAFIVVIFVRRRKAEYEKPRIAVEALGARRDLTAVEAAVILDQKPVRVLTMILFGLLLKKIVSVTATDPLIKLQKLGRPAGEPSPPSRYYELDYLKAIEPDESLDEMMLAQTYLGLRDTVDRKLRGYSREDSVNYYKSIVDKAWTQVTQAGTPELKGDAVDQNIEWLLADEKFDERFKSTFPPGMIILPRPGWWWYWGGPYLPPRQAGVPPAIPTESKPIPGQDFANDVVRGLERTTNSMVKNVQDFTNRLIPAQVVSERERSVRGESGCVCACAHCACACACVGCACACAGGGAR